MCITRMKSNGERGLPWLKPWWWSWSFGFVPSTAAKVNPAHSNLNFPLYLFLDAKTCAIDSVLCEIDLASCVVEVTWFNETKELDTSYPQVCTSIWAVELTCFSESDYFSESWVLLVHFTCSKMALVYFIMTIATLFLYRQSDVDGVLLRWSHWREVIL